MSPTTNEQSSLRRYKLTYHQPQSHATAAFLTRHFVPSTAVFYRFGIEVACPTVILHASLATGLRNMCLLGTVLSQSWAVWGPSLDCLEHITASIIAQLQASENLEAQTYLTHPAAMLHGMLGPGLLKLGLLGIVLWAFWTKGWPLEHRKQHSR